MNSPWSPVDISWMCQLIPVDWPLGCVWRTSHHPLQLAHVHLSSALCLLRRALRPGARLSGLCCVVTPSPAGSTCLFTGSTAGGWGQWEPTDLHKAQLPSCMLLLSLPSVGPSKVTGSGQRCRWHSCEERGRGASSSRAFPSLVLCGSWV